MKKTKEYEKIDPGMCPVCGNPICHVVSINCKKECLLFNTELCYQSERNYNKYGSCSCSFDEIMEAFGKEWIHKYGGYDENQKSKELKAYLFSISSPTMLPDDLFEL